MKTDAGKSKRKPAGKVRFSISEFINPSGVKVFRVGGYKNDGARVRENFETQEEALARKSELDIEAANIVTSTATRMKITRLTDEQVKDAEHAFAKLPVGKSLLEVVEYYAANYREPVFQCTVDAAVALFLADREKQNRRPDTLRNLRGRLGMFTELYGKKNVAEITHDHCHDFVFRKGTSPRNQINDRLVVSNFLNWCVRRKFAPANVITALDRPAVDSHEPCVLSVQDCRRVLASARDYKDGVLLPYFAISLFAGLRPTEITRLNWDRIDLNEGTITLDGSMAKTRQRRIVKLPENAIAWLLPMAPTRPQLIPKCFRKHFRRVLVAAGFGNDGIVKTKQAKAYARAIAKARKAGTELPPEPAKSETLRPWVQDYMRHTAISMYLAKHKHEGEAASWAGNSPNVIHQHYKGLVKETDAAEFWTLTPENVGGNVIPLPAQALA